MTDREMLELAAKAAKLPAFHDLSGKIDGLLIGQQNGSMLPWNPLTDDGDAMRLAVKLHMLIEPCRTMGGKFIEVTAYASGRGDCLGRAAIEGDEYAATRRAIVRAAAEIGKGMLNG